MRKGHRKPFCKNGHPRTPENLANRGCKVCNREAARRRRVEQPAVIRRYQIKYTYGLGEQDLLGMWDRQSGRCACCGDLFDDSNKPVIDHCHKTRAVRGLLCRGCNVGIGYFKERVDAMRGAANYLDAAFGGHRG